MRIEVGARTPGLGENERRRVVLRLAEVVSQAAGFGAGGLDQRTESVAHLVASFRSGAKHGDHVEAVGESRHSQSPLALKGHPTAAKLCNNDPEMHFTNAPMSPIIAGGALAMAIDTLELAVFTSVVRLESFAGAAEAHDMSASGVSRLIARLEEKLGVRLLQRSTRRLSLTAAGAAFHARASRVLSDLEAAEAEASASALRP